LKFVLVSLSITLTVKLAFGQEGDYFLSHHSSSSESFDNINFSLVQDNNGIIWIANRKGIIQYDGQTWTLFETPSAIFQCELSEDNVIYAGGRNLLGRIRLNENNKLEFQELASGWEIDDVLSTISFGDDILFLGEYSLFIFDTTLDSLRVTLEDTGMDFKDLFEYDGKVLLNTVDSGLHELSEDFTAFVQFTRFQEIEDEIRWIDVWSESKSAILTDSGELWLIQADSLQLLDLDDDGYLAGSTPLKLVWVDERLLAASTLSGGVVFIDTDSIRIEEIVNYHTGLPDNQVYTISKDVDDGIWAAHDYGFTRISPLMPLRSYGNIPGLEGNILSVINHGNRIYAGTSLGVYYLDEVKDYRETTYYIEKTRSEPSSASTTQTGSRTKTTDTIIDSPEEDTDDNKKKGLFNFLKKKDKKNKNDTEIQDNSDELVSGQDEATTEDLEETSGQQEDQPGDKKKKQKKSRSGGIFSKIFGGKEITREAPEIEWERRVNRELLSIRHVFKKVEGIPTKTEQILALDDRVIAGSLSGIYQIMDDSTSKISNVPVRYMHYSKPNNKLFVSTYELFQPMKMRC